MQYEQIFEMKRARVTSHYCYGACCNTCKVDYADKFWAQWDAYLASIAAGDAMADDRVPDDNAGAYACREALFGWLAMAEGIAKANACYGADIERRIKELRSKTW